jgi:hypothetical protein
MDLSDEELVLRLRERDGAGRRYAGHDVDACKYSEYYDNQPCPWCEAARRRLDREAARDVERRSSP